MKGNKDIKKSFHKRNSNVSAGIFFILFGTALLVAVNDMLNLGSVGAYFTWESVLMFLGLIMFINRSFLAGFLCIAAGGWFILDNTYFIGLPFVKNIYWPVVLILIGLGFIIASFFKRRDISPNE
jgi:hypothetical protein